MATESTDRQLAAKCYLLDLPGELRNRIYDFAQEDPIIYLADRVTCKDGRPKKIPKGGYNLTRVCRQLRAEYAPVFTARNEVFVDVDDLEEFVKKGCPYLLHDRDGNVLGRLCIIFDGSAAADEVDILPFLKFCKNMSDLWIRATDYGSAWGVRDWLQVLLHVARRPKLQEWLQKTDRIVIHIRGCWIEPYIKAEHQEEWISQWRTGDVSAGIQSWSESSGVPICQLDRMAFLDYGIGLDSTSQTS